MDGRNRTLSRRLTDIDVEVFSALLYVNLAMCGISLIGLFCNTANLIVFFKQGFNETINISLFILTLIDMNVLIGILWSSTCLPPWFEHMGYPFDPVEVGYYGGWFIDVWAHCSCWLAVFVSLERSLCIVKPLKVKQIVTPKVAVTYAVIAVAACFSVILPINARATFVPVWDLKRNKSILRLTFPPGKESSLTVVRSCFLFAQLGSYISLLVSTSVLVVSFREKTEWGRPNATAGSAGGAQGGRGGTSEQDKRTSRENRLIKMVIVICALIIASQTLGTTLTIVSLLEPEFEVKRELELTHVITWTYAFLPYVVNSSINTAIYFKMSSRFRETFKSVFKF